MPKKSKTPRGRKLRADSNGAMVGLRISADERQRYLAAADRRGFKSLSDFLRAAADVACED